MIRRVFWVALFTGLSHLVSLVTVSFVITNLGEETSGYLGVIDSTIMVVASIISFGIQLAVNRNVATKFSWKSNYSLAQASRLMLGLILGLGGLIGYWWFKDIAILVYCMSPLIALNGDYALYGNGKPIAAASLSFLRVALPNLGILALAYLYEIDIVIPYVYLLALGIFLAGVLASRFNQVDYLVVPRKNFVKFYFKYLKVGLYQVVSVLLLAGVLTIGNIFYEIAVIGLVNGLLRILIIYKGGLRIIVQSFFKEIASPGTAAKIDKASILAWGAIAIPVIIFHETTLEILFDDTYDSFKMLMPVFGIIMLLGALRNAAEADALIRRKDNLNLFAFLTAFLVELVIIIAFSYSDAVIWGIPLGILAGEIVLVLYLGIGLGAREFLGNRLLFLLKILPVLILIFLIKLFVVDGLIGITAGMIIYVGYAAFFNRNLLFKAIR